MSLEGPTLSRLFEKAHGSRMTELNVRVNIYRHRRREERRKR